MNKILDFLKTLIVGIIFGGIFAGGLYLLFVFHEYTFWILLFLIFYLLGLAIRGGFNF